MSNNLDRSSAKILVLGDSGVGKTSLIHHICHSVILSSPQPTIGCAIDVKLHDETFFEFWDIGGSRSHKIARSFLYKGCDGIMLVFDATNKKSRSNLDEWLQETSQRDSLDLSGTVNVPTITIASKKDLLPRDSSMSKYSGRANNYSVINLENDESNEVIYVDNLNVQSFNQESENYKKLNQFLRKIIGRKTNQFNIPLAQNYQYHSNLQNRH